jgi:hypothetical protein
MGPFEMIVAIVAIGVAGGVVGKILDTIGKFATPGGGAGRDVRALHQEVQTLRADMESLRQQRGGTTGPGGGSGADGAARLSQLEREIAALRDTTTKFDMSFDAALERLERRLAWIEGTGDAPAATPGTVEPAVVALPAAAAQTAARR